jgi:hypothetical protein
VLWSCGKGSDASSVIFDLVVDEPPWRVALFASDRRLLDVELTRVRRTAW